MVDKLPAFGRASGLIPDTSDRPPPKPTVIGGATPPAPGRAGNRWPTPRQLATLIVNGLLRIPERYRRGMYLDILI